MLGGSGLLYGQSMGFEEDTWDNESSESRFSGLSRKSGTFLRRVQEDTPAAQLQYARGLEEAGRLRAAGRQYNALVHAWPDAAEAPEAQLAYARTLQARGRHEAAFREYQYLIEYYAGLFPYQEVLTAQLETARSVMEQRRGTFLFWSGFESPERAIPLFRILIANGPNWEQIPEIRLLIGQILEENGDDAEAVAAYEEVLMHHGRHAVAREAIYRKALCLKRMADRNPRDDHRTKVALQALFAALREDLPDEQAEVVQSQVQVLRERLEAFQLEQARFYDQNTKNAQAALQGYQAFLRRFPDSDQRVWVEERIASLEARLAAKE